MTTVAFHTLGCKVNHYESEAMMDLFKNKGYQIKDFDEFADVYIVNSCTVTNQAARKSRQLARRAKRQNSDSIVALVGCYTQVSPEEVRDIGEVDLFIGTSNRSNIVEYVEEVLGQGAVDINILERQELSVFEELKVDTLRETTRAYVKIEEGCNQFCSYCIIPYARGPVRSREPQLVLEEVRELVSRGVKEIILTGTHLGAYGYDWKDDNSLERLIVELVKVEGLGHIRLSSIEITEISDYLLDIMSNESKLCPHLHLPLQSGSDKILKKMKRPYTTDDFRKVVEKVREQIPDIAITTDIIVGFPGEDQECFEEHYQFVKELKFSRLHVFPYSIREGTPAARMKEQISGGIKREYSSKMRELNEELMLNYQENFLGKTREIIIEENRDYETNFLTGVTDNYIRVLIDEDSKYMGKMVDAKLVRSLNFESVIGEIVK
ncbi:MAG: tRNA (N(6)-L-threonylcarbamoyladenosine(37)-C(2))-methylthiotransferase MtaB [Halanaerobiales bacterium]